MMHSYVGNVIEESMEPTSWHFDILGACFAALAKILLRDMSQDHHTDWLLPL
ncbi:hypothetical protein Syun_027044 [Stephania yunnanensis]|uniref:Uncharacterized protein n=1 Tax=Stephania yunnanensis TaxID=152371 RepID=A0AAP0EKC9_9MAGN